MYSCLSQSSFLCFIVPFLSRTPRWWAHYCSMHVFCHFQWFIIFAWPSAALYDLDNIVRCVLSHWQFMQCHSDHFWLFPMFACLYPDLSLHQCCNGYVIMIYIPYITYSFFPTQILYYRVSITLLSPFISPIIIKNSNLFPIYYSACRPFLASLKCETENCFCWLSSCWNSLSIGTMNSIRYEENYRLVRIIEKWIYIIIFDIGFETWGQ